MTTLVLPAYGCTQCGELRVSPNGKPLSGKCVTRRGAWEGHTLVACGGDIKYVGHLSFTVRAEEKKQ